MKNYLPNLLTFSRILFTPFLVIFILQDKKWFFLSLLFLAAITDFLDGYIARKFNIVSKNGIIFDAVTDKILIISILATLLITEHINSYFLLSLLLRDLVVIIGACILFLLNLNTSLISSIQHSWPSKIVTFLQFITIILTILSIKSLYLLIVTVFFGLWASVNYIMLGINLIKKRKTNLCY